MGLVKMTQPELTHHAALLAELRQAKTDRAELDVRIKDLTRRLRNEGPRQALVDLATEGPFTLAEAAQRIEASYSTISVQASALVREGRLSRPAYGIYALPGYEAPPEPPETSQEATGQGQAPTGPRKAPRARQRPSRPGGSQARTAPPRPEPSRSAQAAEWMETGEDGLPEVTAPIGTITWQYEMRARRAARRARWEQAI